MGKSFRGKAKIPQSKPSHSLCFWPENWEPANRRNQARRRYGCEDWEIGRELEKDQSTNEDPNNYKIREI